MVCDEAFYRHFHRQQKHTHSHDSSGISEKNSLIREDSSDVKTDRIKGGI